MTNEQFLTLTKKLEELILEQKKSNSLLELLIAVFMGDDEDEAQRPTRPEYLEDVGLDEPLDAPL